MYNKAFLLGYLGKDPEIRKTAGGTTIANISVATSNKFKKNDEWVEKTEWHKIVAFGRQAEVMEEYLTKGSKIFVEGRIETRSWDDEKSGEKKYRTEIVCERFQMLGSPGGEGSSGGGKKSYRKKKEQEEEEYEFADEKGDSEEEEEDDIPF